MSLTDKNQPYSLHFWLEEFEEEGDWSAVARTAREILHLSPGNPEALKYLAEAYFQLEMPVEAYDTAMQLVRANEFSIDGYWLLSDLVAQAGDLEMSADYIEKAACLIPNSDAIWVEVAKANFNLRRLDRCFRATQRGLKINPQNIRLLIYEVFCLLAFRRQQNAKTVAVRLNALGVDAEVLQEIAKELGITASHLAKIQEMSSGQHLRLENYSLPVPKRKRVEKTINGGLRTLSEITSKGVPLTTKQFAMELNAAQRRRQNMEEAADTAMEEMREDGPESHITEDIETAEEVYFVYDKYRTHGPYTLSQMTDLFRDGTFDGSAAFVCSESNREWIKPCELQELASHLQGLSTARK